MKVFKFGGASVKNPDAVRNVKKVLELFPNEDLVVVVSAMGKTTNAMERIAGSLYSGSKKEFLELIAERKSFHFEIMHALFADKSHIIFEEVAAIFQSLEERINDHLAPSYDFEYDQIVSLGEVLSTKIIAAFLANEREYVSWIDARKLVRTNNQYRYAEVDWKISCGLIKEVFHQQPKGMVMVTQGFLGHTEEGFTTTLGREGSDFTAGIFAYCLDAESVTIWKDVPGMLNADPKWFDNTVKLDKISFREAIELSYYGASVIHPKTLKPLQNKAIPLYVKSFLNPEEPGTSIQSSTENDALVPSFIFKMDQVLLSIRAKDFSFIVEENMSEIFAVLAAHGARINLMQNSALNFSVSLDIAPEHLEGLIGALSKSFIVKYNKDLELVTIRHYDQVTIDRVTKNKIILMEQKTRQTARIVMKSFQDVKTLRH